MERSIVAAATARAANSVTTRDQITNNKHELISVLYQTRTLPAFLRTLMDIAKFEPSVVQACIAAVHEHFYVKHIMPRGGWRYYVDAV